ncbi:HAD hydrolase-like protein [Paracrocinitomix mangrovi]|uniref:HAD family hydrolase n=1 Tax=Paracrocinitomix mangrovi TaxID=2862509 RepID=UPI001C8EB715|nr:HAD hydrolase-like protein [Paracrocinitomix mangrovi]UKN02777.1 HAD hydrolase-like protein [Paracrocinitomix mangrovi]
MIIVFDLDDTLYEEITYVKSGFMAVANFVSKQNKGLDKDVVYKEFIDILDKEGRGKVFDLGLKKFNLYSKKMVKSCLTVYRLHNPKISLHKAGKDCLKRFEKYPMYLVTDGNKVVQTKKIDHLGIRKYFKKAMPTHNYGVKNAKPSIYCFNKILQWEKAQPADLVYIADNPKKDFVNLNKNGFKTIRVLTGPYSNYKAEKGFDAMLSIKSLDELTPELLQKL